MVKKCFKNVLQKEIRLLGKHLIQINIRRVALLKKTN